MGRTNTLFAKENIWKLLIRFSVPIMLSFFVSELYGMVDSLFVGNVVGDHALASLSLVSPIQRIIFAVGVMIGTGAATSIARSNGRNDVEGMKKYLVSGFYLTLTVMLCVVAFLIVFGKKILVMTGATESLLAGSYTYLKAEIIGIVFLNLSVYATTVLLTFGDSKASLWANVVGASVNIVLDYIFVVVLRMGILGAGIATSVSEFACFVYAMVHLRKFNKENKVSMRPSIQWKTVAPIFVVGLSAFIVEAEDGVVTGFLNRMVSRAGGEEAVMILGIGLKVYMLLFIANFAVASAMQPVASYTYGSGDYVRLREVVKKTRLFSFAVMTFSWALCMIFAPQLVGIFTGTPELIEKTVPVFRIMILTVPITSVYYLSIFYLQSLGKGKESIFMSIFRHFLVMMPVAFVLERYFHMGLMGIWLSYPISDVVSGVHAAIVMKRSESRLEKKAEEKNREKKEFQTVSPSAMSAAGM